MRRAASYDGGRLPDRESSHNSAPNSAVRASSMEAVSIEPVVLLPLRDLDGRLSHIACKRNGRVPTAFPGMASSEPAHHAVDEPVILVRSVGKKADPSRQV